MKSDLNSLVAAERDAAREMCGNAATHLAASASGRSLLAAVSRLLNDPNFYCGKTLDMEQAALLLRCATGSFPSAAREAIDSMAELLIDEIPRLNRQNESSEI